MPWEALGLDDQDMDGSSLPFSNWALCVAEDDGGGIPSAMADSLALKVTLAAGSTSSLSSMVRLREAVWLASGSSSGRALALVASHLTCLPWGREVTLE